ASLHNLPPSDATADVTLRDNVLTLTSLTVVTTGLEATGKATMQLNEALDVQADAQVEAPDLAEVAPLLAGLPPGVSWDEAGLAGRIQATLTAQGSLQQGSASWQAQGQASLVQGTLYGLPPLDAT